MNKTLRCTKCNEAFGSYDSSEIKERTVIGYCPEYPDCDEPIIKENVELYSQIADYRTQLNVALDALEYYTASSRYAVNITHDTLYKKDRPERTIQIENDKGQVAKQAIRDINEIRKIR